MRVSHLKSTFKILLHKVIIDKYIELQTHLLELSTHTILCNDGLIDMLTKLDYSELYTLLSLYEEESKMWILNGKLSLWETKKEHIIVL